MIGLRATLVSAIAFLTLITPCFSSKARSVRSQEDDIPQEQIRVVSEAVVLDIVVRDRDGRLVTDLRLDEIEVFENGIQQEVLYLQCQAVERSMEDQARNQESSDQVAPESVLEQQSRETEERSMNLVSLVFQGLTTQGRYLARRAALDFVGGGLPENTYLAVFLMSRTLVPVLNFTDDPDEIEAALELIQGANYDELNARIAEVMADSAEAIQGSDSGDWAAAMLTEMMGLTSRIRSFHQAQSIIDSLVSLIHGQRTLEGRKTVILFSEGLFIPKRTADRFEMMISEANLSNVSFYSVDARGVSVASQLGGVSASMSRASATSAGQFDTVGRAPSFNDMTMFEDAEDGIRMDVQEPLRRVSQQTGGSFIVNNNPDVEMRRIREDMTCYCNLAYRPKEILYDGTFRKVEVKVKRRGVSLLARRGYFALPPTDGDPLSAFEVPLLHSLVSDEKQKEVPGESKLVRFDSTPEGIEHVVSTRIPMEKLRFRTDKRSKEFYLHFSIMAVIRDSHGRVLNRFSQDYPLVGNTERLDSFKKGAVFFSRRFSISPGEYILDLVLLDQLKDSTYRDQYPFTVSRPPEGIRLSSISIVGRVEPLSDRPDDQTNPFRYGSAKIVPNLNEPISRSAGDQVGFHYVIYPRQNSDQEPIIGLFIISDGRPVYQGSPIVPARNSNGDIRMVSSLPRALFGPGEYEIWAIVKQGEETAQEFLSFKVVP